MKKFEELNGGKSTVKENIDLKALEFKPLKDFVGQTIHVDGFFFTNGKYGKQVVVVGNGYKINMPERAVAQFEQIASDNDMTDELLKGHLLLTDIRIGETNSGTTTFYRFKDC